MSTLDKIGWYVAPDLHIAFAQATDSNTVQAQLNHTQEPIRVELPEHQFLNQTPLSAAEKVKRILRNCHLHPIGSVDPYGKFIRFTSIGTNMKTWGLVGAQAIAQLVTSPTIWISRMNGTISYVAGPTVMTWDWRSKSYSSTHYKTNEITALAELPDGTIVVGDKQGMLHFNGNTLKTSGKKIEKILTLSSDRLLVDYNSDAWSEKVDISMIHLDKSSTNPFNLNLEKFSRKLTLMDGTILVLNNGKITIHRYDPAQGQFTSTDCKEIAVHSMFPISNTTSKVVIIRNKKITIWDVCDDEKIELESQCINDKISNAKKIFWDGDTLVFDDSSAGAPVIHFCSAKEEKKLALSKAVIDMFLLSDGTIACASNMEPSGVFVLARDGTVVFEQSDPHLGNSTLKELIDGSIAYLSGTRVCVLSAKFKNSPKNSQELEKLEMKELIREIAEHPYQLDLYDHLARCWVYNSKDAAYLLGMVAAVRAADLYRARRFYEEARRIRQKDKEPIEIFRSYLWFLPDKKMLKQVSLELFRMTQDESLIQKDGNVKKRLFVGEADFRFTEAFLAKHKETHRNLASSITATELIETKDENTLKRCASLVEAGVSVFFGIDGTKVHQHFSTQRFERIHWNCPFGNGGDRDDFREVIPKFFLSSSKLQIVGDRIHVTLVNQDGRQTENPIVFGATQAGYRLIRRRAFGSARYPGYVHVETARRDKSNIPFTARGQETEFVFEKTDALLSGAPTRETAAQLQDLQKKKYKIEPGLEPDLKKCRFECSEDGDSSDC